MDPDRYSATIFGAPQRLPARYGYVAYIPASLPRRIDITPENLARLADAEAALGRLAGAGRLLPNPHLFAQPYLRREAVASARIEGTEATLGDLFDAEANDQPFGPDVEEVVNYVRAMESGLARLDTLPISVRLVREMHATLLDGVRGREQQPGKLRTTQNWIGPSGATIETATFVPPPPDRVSELMSDWERLIHEELRLSPLIEAALLHYQFETIHPFLDGNGRLGRLLIVFVLVARERLPEPLLYLSPYFEANRDAYYARLQAVREDGDFDAWLEFFLTGVARQAIDAVERAEHLVDLRERYREEVQQAFRGQIVGVVDLLFARPVLASIVVESALGVSRPTALRMLGQLEDLGVLSPAPMGPRRQRRWRAQQVIDVLTAGDAAGAS